MKRIYETECPSLVCFLKKSNTYASSPEQLVESGL